MTTTQVVETSSLSTITVLYRNYVHLDDQTQPAYGLILLVNFYHATMNRHRRSAVKQAAHHEPL